MRQIDLTDYAHSSKKLHNSLLVHEGRVEVKAKLKKVFAAFVVDSYIAFTASIFVFTLLELSTKNYIISDSLLKIFETSASDYAIFTTYVSTLMSYYFFSFFFNSGQTYGMNLFKVRIDMPEMSLRSSFAWALAMCFLTPTFGIFLPWGVHWMMSEGWGKIVTHDHLYQNLLTDKVIIPIDLVKESPLYEEEKYEEDYKEVA